ncbi:MAG: carboxynorspermidine decarboxylase [Pseudomonadota bacterium]|nr:carboxynorspermidine decarboxylase [Pseudomonadota bacterium]
MLPTQSSGAGRFAELDLSRLPSPCFVIDEIKLTENLQILKDIATAADAKILLALKAFSMWSLAPLINDYLAGCCASGLWEAHLAKKYFAGELSSFAPAFKPSEIEEIATLSSHVVFNNLGQHANFADITRQKGADTGLRINPQHSEGQTAKYDPSMAGSRLGQPLDQLIQLDLPGIDGLHFHNLCEQGFDPLARTVAAIEPYLAAQKGRFKWLNLGGGHMLTQPDYDTEALINLLKRLRSDYDAQIYLEPGTAIAFDAGILVGEVLDVADNDGPIAILDISTTCHMPDVLEAPYRPALINETPGDGVTVMLGGPSCLAGDVIGTYTFPERPISGQRLAFLDQAHYSMVKTTTFNGIKMPSIAIWNSQTDALKLVREFDFGDFERRLS